jgi:hypothetical protein
MISCSETLSRHARGQEETWPGPGAADREDRVDIFRGLAKETGNKDIASSIGRSESVASQEIGRRGGTKSIALRIAGRLRSVQVKVLGAYIHPIDKIQKPVSAQPEDSLI